MATKEGTYWRQMDILSPEQMESAMVTLIGAGGIGSPTALALAKMGIKKLSVYDPDTIEDHNLPNQLYPIKFLDGASYITPIGEMKVDVLAIMLENMTGTEINPIIAKYESQMLSGIVISGVDSMEVRKTIWEGVKANRNLVDLYIEARMGAELGIVYTTNPKDEVQCAWYEANCLYSDGEAIEIPCTARAIIYNTFMIASLIARQVKGYLRSQYLPQEIIMDLANLSLMSSEEVVPEVEHELAA